MVLQSIVRQYQKPIPKAGHYLFCKLDESTTPCKFKTGPRLQYARRGPNLGSESGTMSASSITGSNTNQAQFRKALLARDGGCVLSDRIKGSVACHILPQSRPEYYSEILGHQPGSFHEVEYGLLLQSDYHHSFDQANWGLYPEPEDHNSLVVHNFSDPAMKSYHGKVIDRSRFRVDDAIELPRRDFLAFHYQQCITKHMRGFAYFP